MGIRIGIYGYGNIGKGVERAIGQNADMELVAVFTRRCPCKVKILNTSVPVVSADEVAQYRDKIDVMILCGGSATDLPEQTPALAQWFNVVDSFDTHASIPTHFDRVNTVAEKSGHTAMISVGWDPGLFSVNRVLGEAILPQGATYTFWGKGVSQGHSDAIRRIDGVLDARQYTVPVEEAMERVRRGEEPILSTREKHTRECFVVAEEGADKDRIEREIKTMPHYFDEYDTTVRFISSEELQKNHSGIPHGGCVLRTGLTGEGNRHTVEYRLTLDSNPEFTAGVLVAFARATARLHQEGKTGCYTVLDIPPAYLSPKDGALLRKELL